MFGNLFIRARSGQDLYSFANDIDRVLMIASSEVRQSDSYLGGDYVIGRAYGIEMKIARADDEDFSNYDFILNFNVHGVWMEDCSFLDGLADLIARILTSAGYEVTRALAIDRRNGKRVNYELNPAAPFRDRISIRIS